MLLCFYVIYFWSHMVLLKQIVKPAIINDWCQKKTLTIQSSLKSLPVSQHLFPWQILIEKLPPPENQPPVSIPDPGIVEVLVEILVSSLDEHLLKQSKNRRITVGNILFTNRTHRHSSLVKTRSRCQHQSRNQNLVLNHNTFCLLVIVSKLYYQL